MLRLRRFTIPAVLSMLMLAGAWIRLWNISAHAWEPSTDDAFIQWLATLPAPVPPFDYHITAYRWITAAFTPRQHWEDIIRITPISGHPAFFYLLLHFLLQWTNNPLVLRMLAIIPGLLTIPVVYLLAKETSGILSGLIAALLLTFSDIHIVFSQEIRSYALFVFLLSLMCLSIMRYDSTRKSGWLASYFVFAFLALFTHYGAAILIACIGTLGIWRQARQARWDIYALMNPKFLGWCAMHAMYAAFYFWQYFAFMRGSEDVDLQWGSIPLADRSLISLILMTQMPSLLFFPDSAFFYMLPFFLFAFGLWALYRDRKYEWLAVSLAAYGITCILVIAGMHPHYAVRHFAHLFPVLLIACAYPFSQSIRIDGVKRTALIVLLFIIFVALNLVGPGSTGLNPDLYRKFIASNRIDRQYSVTEQDWNHLIPALNAATRPSDILVTDQPHWLVWELERKRGNDSLQMYERNHYYVCSKALAAAQTMVVLHLRTDKFDDCLREAAIAHPEAARIWYIFYGRATPRNNYEGDTWSSRPASMALERAALQKIEFPSVGAYAFGRKDILKPSGVLKFASPVTGP